MILGIEKRLGMRTIESPECVPGRKKHECGDEENIFGATGDTRVLSRYVIELIKAVNGTKILQNLYNQANINDSLKKNKDTALPDYTATTAN